MAVFTWDCGVRKPNSYRIMERWSKKTKHVFNPLEQTSCVSNSPISFGDFMHQEFPFKTASCVQGKTKVEESAPGAATGMILSLRER
jgi:hypothetical protein